MKPGELLWHQKVDNSWWEQSHDCYKQTTDLCFLLGLTVHLCIILAPQSPNQSLIILGSPLLQCLSFCRFHDCLQLLDSFYVTFRGLSLVLFPNFLGKTKGESKAILTACSFCKYLHRDIFNHCLYLALWEQSPPVQNGIAFHLHSHFGYLAVNSSLAGLQLSSYSIPHRSFLLTPVTAPLLCLLSRPQITGIPKRHYILQAFSYNT